MARALMILSSLESDSRRVQARNSAITRRRLRDEAQVFELSEHEFRAHYRLSKELFSQLCSDLAPYMTRRRRQTKVSIECKVLTALSFYASGSYQKPVGMSYLHGLSQPSVSKSVNEVTQALNHPTILAKYIRFPQNRSERQQIVNRFYQKFGFPGVLGCIDGTHVALVRPSDNEQRFFNRKHYHSRNVQIICDSDLNILNIDATFGGSTHDAYIWKKHALNGYLQLLQQNGENVWLLGDSGYPLRPWLLTPIVNAEDASAEQHYTDIHCRSRNTVERCIGVLKARWRCLLAHRVLHYNHHTVAKIINACAVLHNMANRCRLPAPHIPPEEILHDQRLQDGDANAPPASSTAEEAQHLERGRQQRAAIVQRLWVNR